MPWTAIALALLIALVSLIVRFTLLAPRPRGEGGEAKPAPKAPAAPGSARAEAKSGAKLGAKSGEKPAEKASAAKAGDRSSAKPAEKAPKAVEKGAKAVEKSSTADLPRMTDEADDDSDITIVTLGPLMGALPQLPMSAFDDDEVVQPGPEAVPIIYDNDAAVDEPTRIEALILVSAAGQTDRGQRRKKNEDSYVILEDHNLFVVADGMGGHAGGEVASKIAVDTVAQAFRASDFKGERYTNVPRRGSDLALAIQMANEAIFERAKAAPELTGMGTTIVAARFSPNKQRLYIGHVGDSRCYRLRDKALKQVTTDHTMGAIGITGPLADRLERAVGIAPAVKVDVIIARPLPNDLYLLCSDGLSKMVSQDEMQEILLADRNLDKVSTRLIEKANESGGRDNITVILVQVRSPSSLF